MNHCWYRKEAKRSSSNLSSMATLPLNLAYCGLPSISSLRESSFLPLSSATCSRRHATFGRARRWALPAAMSLTNDIVVKALEVGVATFLGNTVATQQAVKEKSSGFFNLGKKPKRKQGSTTTSGSSQVSNVVSEVLSLADQLPELVDKGGPDGKRWVKLAICIAIDLVGSGSLGVPLLGDALDLVTAPITAAMLQALFGNTLVTVGGLAEEILPGTDGIPTATLAWLAENYGYFRSVSEKRKT